MKKKRMIIAAGLTLVLISSALTGCSDDDREDMLEDKVEQLEQQVTDLENKNSGSGPAESSDDQGAAGQASEGAAEAGDADYETLKAAVDAAIGKVDSTTPSGTPKEQREQFYTLKKELDDIDHQLDLYDDNLEKEYRSGSLDVAAYRQQEREIDALEDKLGTSEERLEVLFGIDG